MPKKPIHQRLFQLAKHKFRHFFGLDLAKREIELNFIFSQSRRGKRPVLNKTEIVEEFTAFGLEAEGVLRKALRDLEQANKSKINGFKRFGFNKIYLTRTYPTLVRLQNKYRIDGRIPDDNVRKDELEKSIRILEEFIISYQHCFSFFYGMPNWIYVFLGKDISICAVRIFELTEMLQEFRALRYMPLPANFWASVNKVFHVMNVYESVDKALPTIKSQMHNHKTTDESVSLQHLFINIQLFGYFDTLNFPTEYFVYLKSLIREQRRLLTAETIENLGEQKWSQETLFVSSEQKRCPRIEDEVNADQLPGWKICIQPLRVNILKNYIDLMEAVGKNDLANVNTRLFKRLPMQERVTFMMLLNASLKLPREYNYQTAKPVELTLFVGFRDCYAIYSRGSVDQREPQTLKETFEARKKFIAKKSQHSSSDTMWYLLNDSKQYLILQSDETPATVSLAIGRPMVYRYSGTSNVLALGIVSRLERRASNRFVVHIRKLAHHAEAVSFTELAHEADWSEAESTGIHLGRPAIVESSDKIPTTDAENDKTPTSEKSAERVKAQKLPALIVLIGNTWHLMLVNQIEYFNGKPILLYRGFSSREQKVNAAGTTSHGVISSEAVRCSLGKLVTSTVEFTLFELVGDEVCFPPTKSVMTN